MRSAYRSELVLNRHFPGGLWQRDPDKYPAVISSVPNASCNAKVGDDAFWQPRPGTRACRSRVMLTGIYTRTPHTRN